MDDPPVLIWFRRDLRLGDHPALDAAARSGAPVIPVFVHDETVEALGAAAKWRLGEGLRVFGAALEAAGSRLILRRGAAEDVLRDLVQETGAQAVYWQRMYAGEAIARDTAVKAALTRAGIKAESFPGAVLFEPWTVQTGQGKPYSVYSPFWRAVRTRDPGSPLVPPKRLRAPESWPASDRLEDWRMGAAMRRGAGVVAAYATIGEAAAAARLTAFFEEKLRCYALERDLPASDATSGLSENLSWGEIAPRRIWKAGMAAREAGVEGAEKFLSELVWRDFAWHLLYHHPRMARENWRAGWDAFPWRGDNAEAERWRRGMTGEPFVDAAMREMFVTGRMHNRARMIAASYLTKHLLTDWRVGLAWFQDCLTDWDPASNAMGWQWVAGCGPDAAPYFRIFNPETQAEKFDPDGAYRRAFIAEGQRTPPATATDYFAAVPERWGLSPVQAYPGRILSLSAGRDRALAAYARRDSAPAG
ncbi:MAG: deoxyribodipyrimidine photo-lyase [Rhodobacteraceae bacterium]|nr:deoxyribodipyrimidine photo-lyase [Paracoccaceae bacterium]